MIRLAVPQIDEDDLDAVAAALRSGYLVQGDRVRAFEERVGAAIGTAHVVAVSNCTAALHLALLALDIGPGDAVAVTTYSWPATANVIALCGAVPIFVDIDSSTFNIDPERLEDTLRGHHRVRAILPVHAFGAMADMPRIQALAHAHGIPVVEDAACALGASLGGRPAGSWGRLGCFSFHPRKAVTTGEGGVITTDDAGLARRLRALRNHGLDPTAGTPDFVMPGYNYRLTEFQAALGVTQLNKLDAIVARRRSLAAEYDRLFAGTTLSAQGALEPMAHVYQSYVTLLPSGVAARRGEILAALRERGIEATIGTYHMPLITHFRARFGFRAGDFPVTDDVAARAITLPLHPGLTGEEQRFVVDSVLECVQRERQPEDAAH